MRAGRGQGQVVQDLVGCQEDFSLFLSEEEALRAVVRGGTCPDSSVHNVLCLLFGEQIG